MLQNHTNMTFAMMEFMLYENVTDASQQQFGVRVAYATTLVILSFFGLIGNVAVSGTNDSLIFWYYLNFFS